VHADFSVEASPANRKTQSFVDLDEESVISFLIEILRRLNALFTPFYTPNLLHADFSVEASTANHKPQSFADFVQKYVLLPSRL
jgi:hypothetical protein